MGGRLDAMVCGVGSGGTITGLSRCFARAMPECQMVLADPEGSILAGYVRTGEFGAAGSWAVEGIGEDFLPPICDLSRVTHTYTIPDAESFGASRALLRDAGILAGSSSGTLLAAALRYCREQATPKRVLTLICDSGAKYLSKTFNDAWMLEQGLLQRRRAGDLRDVVTRLFADRAVVTVAPDDALVVAYARMRLHDVSQLPVVDKGRIVGIVDESDLLRAAIDDVSGLQARVGEVMSTRLETVGPSTPIAALLPMFDAGLVPIVVDGEAFVGLVTRMDLVSFLRRRAREAPAATGVAW
jgi:cystathionine beta-synthase